MLDSEKIALEAKLRAECEAGYVIGPSAVGYLSVTAETFDVLNGTGFHGTAETVYDAALAAFKVYAAGKSGTLYWRIHPELSEKDGKLAFYMRLLISDMPAIKKPSAA